MCPLELVLLLQSSALCLVEHIVCNMFTHCLYLFPLFLKIKIFECVTPAFMHLSEFEEKESERFLRLIQPQGKVNPES